MDINQINIADYLEKLASKSPVPGGGGVSALASALAVALSEMVCNLTKGKKKFAYIEDDIVALLAQLEEDRKYFVFLSNEDARVFEPLSKAYSLPSGTKEELRYKEELMEKLLLDAATVPLNIIRKVHSLSDILHYLSENSSKLAISDVGVSAYMFITGLKAAVLNVYINTKYMKDKTVAAELMKEAKSLSDEAVEKYDKIYEKVLGELI